MCMLKSVGSQQWRKSQDGLNRVLTFNHENAMEASNGESGKRRIRISFEVCGCSTCVLRSQ